MTRKHIFLKANVDKRALTYQKAPETTMKKVWFSLADSRSNPSFSGVDPTMQSSTFFSQPILLCTIMILSYRIINDVHSVTLKKLRTSTLASSGVDVFEVPIEVGGFISSCKYEKL